MTIRKLLLGMGGFGLVVLAVSLAIALFPRSEPAPGAGRCYADALAAYLYGGVSLVRGEDEEYVAAYVARAVAFDPELAAIWSKVTRDELPPILFHLLLEARAWSEPACPK